MFDQLFRFEEVLANYTGAKYAVATDGCTHAIELAMRYDRVKSCKFTAYTYLSIPQMLGELGINYQLIDETWRSEYQFYGTRIWDSARRLERNMFRQHAIQCLSFGHGKPLQIGKLGAVLTNDAEVYNQLSKWRSDGRDLRISPWADQAIFGKGWHYCPTLENCATATTKLLESTDFMASSANYPDLRKLRIQPSSADFS
jgi:dTDP-4-amino-4,6-dideoxygalactose transaminase